MIRSIPREYFAALDIVNNSINKKENMIFIYSNLGFRDNIKAIYDHLIEYEYNRDYKIICSLNDYGKYKKNAPKNVKFVDNYRGILYFFQAKYCFYCFGKYPIKPANEQIIFNLWHGMPLKKIGNLLEGKELVDYNYFSHVLATSEFYRPIMAQAFNCHERNVFICGEPRADELFADVKNNSTQALMEKENRNIMKMKELLNGKYWDKLFIWLPTFRDNDTSGKIPMFTFDGLEKLNLELIRKNAILLIKPHPLAKIIKEHYAGYSNIIVRTQDEIEQRQLSLYTILRYTDALITDYSSVYFDYLLLNRPIGFTVDDMHSYRESRGFVFEYPLEYMPGEKIMKEDDFIKFIQLCIQGEDTFVYDRSEMNDMVNYYKDGRNCERILEKMGI